MIEIRRFEKDELDKFLSIRRSALETDPNRFADTVANFDAREPFLKRDNFKRLVDSKTDIAIGAFDDDKSVGMAVLARDLRTKKRGLISGVYVHPEYRGKQIGEKMMQFFFAQIADAEWLSEVVLSVTSDNVHAITVYERVGMKKFDPPPEDQLMKTVCREDTHMVWVK